MTVYVVAINWGPYDGGDEVLFVTLNEHQAEARRCDLDREHGGVVVLAYEMDVLLPRKGSEQ